jgi:ribA/ribD-fused uncharacterized protein
MKPILSFTGDYHFLSNFYFTDIEIYDIVFPSAENAYQAAKSDKHEERLQFKDITPGMSKRLGQKIFVKDGIEMWNKRRLRVMEEILRVKFSNPELKQMLVETAPRELQEGNYWGDTFWGVYKGEGHNYLGKLLMMIRDNNIFYGEILL